MATSVEIYKKNQKRAKIFKILSPIIRYGLLALGIILLILAIVNSFGNIVEISKLLNGKTYTDEELVQNYAYLIEKYGEWKIGNGGSGFYISFIDIRKAIFSALMITNCICGAIFILASNILGKWVLPMVANSITENNQDFVNLTLLEKEKNKE